MKSRVKVRHNLNTWNELSFLFFHDPTSVLKLLLYRELLTSDTSVNNTYTLAVQIICQNESLRKLPLNLDLHVQLSVKNIHK